jgi:hypothetical protein
MMTVFPNFHNKHGSVFDAKPVPTEIIEKYKDIVPRSLIRLWEEDGWGGYAEGLLWTIDPTKYQEIVPRWIELGANGVPFMRTCFGDLLVWDDKTMGRTVKMIDIRHCQREIICEGMRHMFEVSFCHDVYLNYALKTDEFSEIKKRLGALRSEECYGYEPVLILGGDEILDNLKKVNFDVYLDILTQLIDEPVD